MLSSIGINSRNRSSPRFGYYTYTGPRTHRAGPSMGHSSTSPPARKKKKRGGDLLLYSAGVLPPVRRVGSVPQRIDDGNNIGAGLQIGLMALNLAGDAREIELAGSEAVNLVKGKGLPYLKNTKGQHAMTLFGGTILEPLANKFPFFRKIMEHDAAIYDTRFGKWLQNKFKLDIDYSKPETIKRDPIKIPFTKKEIKPLNEYIPAYKFKGNYFQRLAGRSLHRISKLGLIAATALEIPLLVNSVTKTEGTAGDKAKAFGKQVVKSGMFVGLVNGAIAVGGAILAPYGAISALLGMAAGSGASLAASKEFNRQVDKIGKHEPN